MATTNPPSTQNIPDDQTGIDICASRIQYLLKKRQTPNLSKPEITKLNAEIRELKIIRDTIEAQLIDDHKESRKKKSKPVPKKVPARSKREKAPPPESSSEDESEEEYSDESEEEERAPPKRNKKKSSTRRPVTPEREKAPVPPPPPPAAEPPKVEPPSKRKSKALWKDTDADGNEYSVWEHWFGSK
jgi:hypothetical protein